MTRLSDLTLDSKKLEGIWWDHVTYGPCPDNKPHPEHFCIRVAPPGPEVRQAIQEITAPHQMAIRRGKADPSIVKNAQAKAWSKHVLLEWVNLEGETYSQDRAAELLADERYRPFANFVQFAAHSEWAYLADAEGEAKGNSQSCSPGDSGTTSSTSSA